MERYVRSQTLKEKWFKSYKLMITVFLLIFFFTSHEGETRCTRCGLIDPEDQICLAKNMYFEARDQGLAAQIAVSLVVFNRVQHSSYPKSICEVIYQGPTYSWRPEYPVRNRCQFSWFCDGLSDVPKELDAWNYALNLSKTLVSADHLDFTEGATHYHASDILPHWASQLTRIMELEDHIFYRLDR
jgi:spore germination cell wall hydrolase CwlJ-like protein